MIPNDCRPRTAYAFSDYVYWNGFLLIPVVCAVTAIATRSLLWCGAYALFSAAVLAVVMRFFCAHCPHYTRESARVHCLFLWGWPKPFTPRPRPLSIPDKILSVTATGLWALFPLFWLRWRIDLLVVYLLSLTMIAWTLKRTECSRCIYADCPVNRSGEAPEPKRE